VLTAINVAPTWAQDLPDGAGKDTTVRICTGCHGADASGTVLGPDLKAGHWLWSDGSYAAIAKTITAGVPQPKQFRAAMPPMGGAQLTPAEVSAVAAFIWGLSHRS